MAATFWTFQYFMSITSATSVGDSSHLLANFLTFGGFGCAWPLGFVWRASAWQGVGE
ncbi:hypothetical protein B0H10DRAFT_2091242 [Mycena sp. CBHHK59/15]|nr:hypothetical protein B0H10DRAFT_2134451 [Mycena sp. CBHHK59/15]KAJ6559508.1 hypothetical protein B0H10DRAFT_2119227 [Mycena sp. CBHHK59/15]KAJ6590338.1 hypothetical protein B0H10DRAFT_2092613 [Mycena sp. CBHHK59/15]KAJ6591314.1 hypothetical protein B0H10DRAFT_2091242 [Mycena sp. CBHHK59/15]